MSNPSLASIQSAKENSSHFDELLISRKASRKALVMRAFVGALSIVALEGLPHLFGIASSGAFAVVTALTLIPWVSAPLYESRRLTERVRINNGVVRISRYVENNLVDQRRFKTLGLAVDCQSDATRDCVRLELVSRNRTFEIAGHLTPSERSKFLVRFLDALHEAGVDPQIQRTFRPRISSSRRPFERGGLRSVSYFPRIVRERRIGCRVTAGSSVSIPPETCARYGRPAADTPPPGLPSFMPDMRHRPLGESNGVAISDQNVGRADADVVEVRRSTGRIAKLGRELWTVGVVAAVLSSIFELHISSPSSDARSLDRGEPSFRLISSRGEIIDSRSMSGRPYVVFFGFTKCPEVCSTTLLELARVMRDLGPRAASFQIYFVSLDPERDSPEVLTEFLASFDPRFVGLTGTIEEIARAAAAFRVYHRKVPLEGGGYTIDHTTLVYLVDRRGQLADTISFMEHRDKASLRLKALILDEAESRAVQSRRYAILARCVRSAAGRKGRTRTLPLFERECECDRRTRDNVTHCAQIDVA